MPIITLWAPLADRARLRLASPGAVTDHEMTPGADGLWQADVAELVPGVSYGFVLGDDENLLTDPRSRRQPDGVHGPSQVYADDFTWTDAGWFGRPLAGGVVYELHVGTFTEQGTFDAALDKLDHLIELGISHVELLPVNDFNGTWNWGYDGVLWFAVHETYGGPDGLKRFVDACHRRGVAVILDVVYNHLGPSGNYLPRYGPYFATGRSTWGDLINLDGQGAAQVRRYILDNVTQWLGEFHIDGLRLDAVHALQDTSEPHLLAELGTEVDALATALGRELFLIAESDLNDPVMITSREAGGYGLDAQWDDDMHHCLHALLTGERQGYYVDFGSLKTLAQALTNAFVHDGSYSTFRERDHGKPVDRAATPGHRFVVCLQNHDQIGNRAAGDRMSETVSPQMLAVGALLLLTSPFTPMLWMGEEWAASTRWTFFTSHPEPELGEATGKGRIAEFGQHGWDVSQMIDPQDPSAYRSSQLNWDEVEETGHQQMLHLYRTLIALRKSHPALSDPRLDRVKVDFDEAAGWLAVHRGHLRVVVNVSSESYAVDLGAEQLLFGTQPDIKIARGAVVLPAHSGAVVTVG